MFEAFDWPYSIQLVRITEGYTNQTTGEFVPASEETVDIKGHISDITMKDLQGDSEGIYEMGDQKLYVDKSYGVKEGDKIKITEADSSISEWKVMRKERSYGVLGQFSTSSREGFLLRRI